MSDVSWKNYAIYFHWHPKVMDLKYFMLPVRINYPLDGFLLIAQILSISSTFIRSSMSFVCVSAEALWSWRASRTRTSWMGTMIPCQINMAAPPTSAPRSSMPAAATRGRQLTSGAWASCFIPSSWGATLSTMSNPARCSAKSAGATSTSQKRWRPRPSAWSAPSSVGSRRSASPLGRFWSTRGLPHPGR